MNRQTDIYTVLATNRDWREVRAERRQAGGALARDRQRQRETAKATLIAARRSRFLTGWRRRLAEAEARLGGQP